MVYGRQVVKVVMRLACFNIQRWLMIEILEEGQAALSPLG